MLSQQAIADRIGCISPAGVRPLAFRVIDRVQGNDPAAQLVATAVALVAMSEACGLRMRDVINVAENCIRDCEGPYTEHIQAIRMYANHEIRRGGQ